MENKTLEQKTAETILQTPMTVEIGDKEYQVAPPSIATLILVSEAVSSLPAVKIGDENPFAELLSVAKDCRAVGEILAILILGAKGLSAEEKVIRKRFFGLLHEEKTVIRDNKAELSRRILEDLTPRQISELFGKLLSRTQIAFFLGIITSLTGINLLKKTKN